MDEKKSYDLLLEYSQKRGLEYQSFDKNGRLLLSVNSPIQSDKFIIFRLENDCWFVARDSYSNTLGMTETSCGIYSAIQLSPSVKFKITIKDKLDWLFRNHKVKTGDNLVDGKLTICTNQDSVPKSLVQYDDIALLETLNSRIKPLSIIIENNYFASLTAFKDKVVIGLETNSWVYQEEEVDFFVSKGVELLANIKGRFI